MEERKEGGAAAFLAGPAMDDPVVLNRVRRIARYSSLFSAVIGLSTLLGWFLDIDFLKRLVPGLASMKANTGLAFLTAGVCTAVFLPYGRPGARAAGSVGAFLVFLIGFLSWCEYLYGVDLGIDELIIRDRDSPLLPGRMAPMTAICFCVLSAGMFASAWGLGRARQGAALLLMMLSMIPLLGYAYGVSALYTLEPYTSMALHTVVAFHVLAVALLFLEPGTGIPRLFLSTTAGGTTARRLLPLILLSIYGIGWTCVWGIHMGQFTPEFAVALFGVLCIFFSAAVVLWHASILHRTDLQRLAKETEARELSESLERKVEERTRQLQDTLDHVKQLRGLLPVCAWCKKVRDDRNYWQTLESYLGEHTDARITHGICPECLQTAATEEPAGPIK